MNTRGWLWALALNVLVSALVTWAVLTWWQRSHPCPGVAPGTSMGPAPMTTEGGAGPSEPWFAYVVQPDDTWRGLNARFELKPGRLQAFNDLSSDAPLVPGQMIRVPGTPPPTPAGDPHDLNVTDVLGAGVLPDERVRLRNTGARPLNLEGWALEDEDGHRFVFPAVVLYPQGELQVWTKTGTPTVNALYWGLSEAVWSPGESVTLRAPDGTVAATYSVP